ncbi:hypothetical protein EVJ58_g8772 [Rhodofomes roseus]|uniref:3,4-dihydroxy-2-butanone-4-phosphate synthase n=1 Tax=Rhodofomes roseus TaxID=34475 RepID=A0A4Y9XZN1_9APHY|nr:hypothetical protein EVJ58_g8772 [Rhodofomes roseus]
MAPVATSPESSSAPPTPLKHQPGPPIVDHTAPMEGDSHPAPRLPKHSARPQAVDAPARAEFAFDGMEEALEAFGRGEFVVVMDDEGRENEGDLIIAASEVSTEKMAWMIKHTSGYICIALPGERLDELAIPMMVSENQDPHRTAYTVTVDYRHGTTTGISAHDRALTARALASPSSQPSHFSRPGHLVPLRARPGGHPRAARAHRDRGGHVRAHGPPARGRAVRACGGRRGGEHDAAGWVPTVCGSVGAEDDQRGYVSGVEATQGGRAKRERASIRYVIVFRDVHSPVALRAERLPEHDVLLRHWCHTGLWVKVPALDDALDPH